MDHRMCGATAPPTWMWRSQSSMSGGSVNIQGTWPPAVGLSTADGRLLPRRRLTMLRAVVPKNQDEPRSWTVAQVLKWTQGRFAAAGLRSPRLDAELLIAHGLAWPR